MSGDSAIQPSAKDSRVDLAGRQLWIRSMVIAVVLVGAVVAAASISRGTGSQQDQPRLTHTIGRGDLVVSVTEQGTLESSNNTEVRCKVRGSSTVTWVIEGGTMVEAGDELVRLDTKNIEETVSLQKTNVHTSTATLERSKADVARAEIGIQAYLEGRFRTQMKTLDKQVSVAKTNLETAQTMLAHSRKMFRRGFVSDLEVQGNAFTVTQAELELKVKQTEVDALQKYTKEMELETLRGNLTASRSKLQADEAGLAMDQARLERALQELEECVVRADRAGLVIHPSAAAWKDAPEITEGATVRHDQILLLMPDLSEMQVKVGIHESVIDRMSPGLEVRVVLPDQVLKAQVSEVSPVTRPAGWWTGNVVKYDSIIELPSAQGLKPGMSAEVEIVLAKHQDVPMIPVSAVVTTEEGDFCWIKTERAVERRQLKLGDTNEVFIVVRDGVKEGDEAVLNPQAYVDETKDGG